MADTALAAATTNLTRAKYAGLDFDTHEDDLRAEIQVKFAATYNDFAASATGIMLLDIVAYGLDTLSFYLDRRVTDTFLQTARTRKSVTRLCRQLGYRIRGAVASSVDLEVASPVGAPYPYVLQKLFQFKGPNGLVFENAQDVTYTAAGTKTVSCYEGVTVTESFVSDGTANQAFEINSVPADHFIVDGTAVLTVGGAPWQENEFITYEATNQYEMSPTDDPPTFRFGDGVAGNIPPAGASIVLTYVASMGKAGQATAGTITDVVAPLVVAFTTVPLTVNNPEGAAGGDDMESLEHAKVYAARVYKTRKVAVTREDYEALAGSYADPLFGKVAVAQALSSKSAATDILLINLISAVQSLVDSIVPGVTSAVTDGTTVKLPAIEAELATMLTTLTDAATQSSGVDTDLVSVMSDGHAMKNYATEIQVDSTDIQNLVTAPLTDPVPGLKALITNVPDAVADGLLPATKSAWKTQLDLITAKGTTITSSASSLAARADGEIATIGSSRNKLVVLGRSLGEGDLLALATSRTTISTNVGSNTSTPKTGLYLDFEDITEAAIDVSELVAEDLQAIYDHVDRFLSADCKANLVSVPILVKRPDGFFTAPTHGLLASLQTFLDQRKEVTQTVEVCSGINFLVAVSMKLRVGVLSGYAFSVVESNVLTAVDGILRDRKFGESLYVSKVYDTIRQNVAGIGFLNVEVTGTSPSGYTDANGNVIMDAGHIITKGTITVTTEAAV